MRPVYGEVLSDGGFESGGHLARFVVCFGVVGCPVVFCGGGELFVGEVGGLSPGSVVGSVPSKGDVVYAEAAEVR